MERDTHHYGTGAQHMKGTKRATHQRLWWMELARGIMAIALGLLLLMARPFAPRLLIYSLGAYLLIDGLLELYSIRNRKIASQHRVSALDAAGGAASLLTGMLCLLFPNVTLVVLSSILGLRMIVDGLSQMRVAKRARGDSPAFLWISNSLSVLLGLVLLLFPSLVMTFLVLFLGSYLLVAGTYLLLRGLSLHFTARRLPTSHLQSSDAPPGLSDDLPPSTRRAIVFVRRPGANGLGHIGWGFEWRNGWFYVGSVENTGSKPFAKPEDMGFWCMQTLEPIATMQHREYPYDEYKLFFVAQPHPKGAWKTLIWESQEPYSFVHHNCCDVAYEVLRAYGCTEVLDPATEYIPNDWYDALAGPSYTIEEHPALPVSRYTPSRREIARREVAVVIPSRMKGSSPPWCMQGWRPWEELTLVWEMMLGHIRTLCISGIKLIAQHRRSRTPHP
jgi:uncharacterized membrane protein HdeD (DUF308 family)